MYKNVSNFTGLNALRFFAAYLVVIHHAEQIRMKHGMFNLKAYSLFNNGSIAVTFFFVLSGFLITYLLLKEQAKTESISIKKFYTRRILRIWPLYFFLVLMGTVLVPLLLQYINNPYKMPYNFQDVIIYFVFFTPFMVNIFFGHHLLEPLWSIGVEELFYIIWAPLLKYLKNNILTILIGVICVKTIINLIFLYGDTSPIIQRILLMLQFEAMAIGGLGAYLLYNSKIEITSYKFFSTPAQIIMFSFIFIWLFASRYLVENIYIFKYLFNTPVLSGLILITAFLWLIINISLNKKSLLKLNNKYLDYLGDISYGIYMYQMLVVFGIMLVLSKLLTNMNHFMATFIFYVILTLTIIIISAFSKRIFEDKFLLLKKKYQ